MSRIHLQTGATTRTDFMLESMKKKTTVEIRKRTTKLTSITLIMLLMTLSSCLLRGSTSLVSGWVTKSGNAVARHNRLSRLNVPGAMATEVQLNGNKRPRNLSFFKNHKQGDLLKLHASTFQNEEMSYKRSYYAYNIGAPIQNTNRMKSSAHYRYNRNDKYSQKRIGRRNLSTEAKTDENIEIVNNRHCDNQTNINNHKEERKNCIEIESSISKKSRKPFVSVLSIDPEHVDIYERSKHKKVIETEKEKNKLISGNPFGNRNFIDMFRGSANYIASHRNNMAVFHIPGDLMDENPTGFRDLMNDISLSWLLGMKIVIVAGCRYQIDKRHKEKDRERQEFMGMVVTDQESLRIVKEEAGYVRFEIERQLARALQSGLSSGHRNSNGGGSSDGEGNVVSGNFYSAQPFGVLDGVDYQYSGFVRRMETNKIHQVHQNRDIVLLTSLGFSPTGEVFNVNSEYLAAYAASELGASKVIYFLEKDAALRHKIHGTRIPHLRVNDGRNLLDLNGVRTETKGFVYLDDCPFKCGPEQMFLVKMGWGMKALLAGVKRVHLISPNDGELLQELYTRDGSGTMISGDLYDGIQSATVDDATAIYDLVTPLVEKGILVERKKAALERDIDQYHVYTRDGLLVACGQMKMFEDGYAEFGCLVVNPLYRARGKGDAMLGYLERLCVQNGATNMFVLSTQTMEWFVERGFDEVGVECLPPSRQATYNHDRGSKIYMKKVTSIRDLDANELFWDL